MTSSPTDAGSHHPGANYAPYIQPQFVSIIDCILLGFITLTGIGGNLLIFATILNEKRLQNQSNALVLNIAVADIFVMSFVFPVIMGNVIQGDSILNYEACVFASCVVVVTCAVSIASMAIISANRYMFICRNHEYQKYFSKRMTGIIIAAMWIFWIVFLAISGIWLPHEYNPDSYICIFNHQNSLFFTAFLMGFGIGLPAMITFFCYYKIYKKVSKSAAALKQHQQISVISDDKEKRKQQRKQRENRATAALFVAFMCFLLFWGPYGIAAVIYYFQRLPQYTIKYLSWIGMSNSCVNSFVYGAMNKTYRDGYMRILTCGRGRVQPGNRNSPTKDRQIRMLSVTSL